MKRHGNKKLLEERMEVDTYLMRRYWVRGWMYPIKPISRTFLSYRIRRTINVTHVCERKIYKYTHGQPVTVGDISRWRHVLITAPYQNNIISHPLPIILHARRASSLAGIFLENYYVTRRTCRIEGYSIRKPSFWRLPFSRSNESQAFLSGNIEVLPHSNCRIIAEYFTCWRG